MDALGYLALACAKEYGTTRGHLAMVNMLMRKVLRLAGLSTTAEVPYLLPGRDGRPGDIHHEKRDTHGLPLVGTAFDVTVHSAHTQHNLGNPVLDGGMAAAGAGVAKSKRCAEHCEAPHRRR